MNSSSADTITLAGSTGTISGSSWSGLTTDQISSLTTAQITQLDTSLWSSTIQNWQQIPFKETWPDWFRVQNMRKQYPSLDKALTQLETIYNIVKDDYDNPTPKR